MPALLGWHFYKLHCKGLTGLRGTAISAVSKSVVIY
jgi:hypothetical protein